MRSPGASPRMTRALHLAAIGLALAAAARAHDAAPPAAIRWELPAPGTYDLPPIAHVPDFSLLDERGAPARLLDLGPDQVAIVSFVYTRCADGKGCPAALAILPRLDRAVAADRELAGRVRIATVSFDPAHDSPARMAELRQALAPRGAWRFLTAASPEAIAPVLSAFGQDALPLVGADAHELGLFRHVLKVFLVDASGAIRNIYSAGFLSPELLLVDARTVLLDPRTPRT